MTEQNNKLGPFDPNNNYSVYAAAMSLLALFADTLLDVINEKLTPLYGKDWQEQLVNLKLLEEDQNLRDVHALLKELSRNGMSQLRIPLKERISKRESQKKFFDELANLLAERNAWVHRHVQETRDELKGLTELVRAVSAMAELATTAECELLLSNLRLTPQTEPIAVAKPTHVEQKSAPLADIPAKKWNFGDPIHSQFTSHSYTIADDYDVIDRISESRLSQINPATLIGLKDSLVKLRTGARLRITHDGVLSAFFAENWGFVSQVKQEEWFPNHIQNV